MQGYYRTPASGTREASRVTDHQVDRGHILSPRPLHLLARPHRHPLAVTVAATVGLDVWAERAY